MDFTKANYLTGINNKGFIADLMPHYPVYVPLLTPEAQAALGKPRPDMEEVMALLENEGFNYRGYVDIFDAGPTLEARTDNVRSVRQNQQTVAHIGESSDEAALRPALISNTSLENYRCLMTRIDPAQPVISAEQANLLQVDEGGDIRLLMLEEAELG